MELAATAELLAKVSYLQARLAAAENEITFLRTHKWLAQGLRGESIIASMVPGMKTAYSAPVDYITYAGRRLEIKFSKLSSSGNGTTLRWNWTKPLGYRDKGKPYHNLILIGENDFRYYDPISNKCPYVFFVVPRSEVRSIMYPGRTSGGQITLSSNLWKLSESPNPPPLLQFQETFDDVQRLLNAPLE